LTSKLSASFVCNWRCVHFPFFLILLHKYHIDGKHVRVYHSRIFKQTGFLAMAISKYGHWRCGASQDWQAPTIIYYNRRIQNNDIFTIWIVNQYIYYKWCGFRTISFSQSNCTKTTPYVITVAWYTEYLMYLFHCEETRPLVSIFTLIPSYIQMLDFHWIKAMLFSRKYYDFLQFFLHHGIFFPPF
jgi:hypothetical protein